MRAKWRVFLADDHALVRDGLKSLINVQPDMCVIGESGDGLATVGFCQELQPDVIVADISMPGLSGVDIIRKVHAVCPQSRTLVLTMHESAAYIRQVLEAGARGYVVKRSCGEELIHGIRSVASGGIYIDPKVAEKLTGGLRSFGGRTPLAEALSEREADVLRMSAEGHSSREIATKLNIGKKSVDTYKARAMQKLGLESRSDIVRYAISQGWLI